MSIAFRSNGKSWYRAGHVARQTSRPTCPPAPKTKNFLHPFQSRSGGNKLFGYRLLGLRAFAAWVTCVCRRIGPVSRFDRAVLAEEAVEIGDGSGEAVGERSGG